MRTVRWSGERFRSNATAVGSSASLEKSTDSSSRVLYRFHDSVLASLRTPVIDQAIPGNPDQPSNGNLPYNAGPSRPKHRGKERVCSNLFGDDSAADSTKEVAVHLWQSVVVEPESGHQPPRSALRLLPYLFIVSDRHTPSRFPRKISSDLRSAPIRECSDERRSTQHCDLAD